METALLRPFPAAVLSLLILTSGVAPSFCFGQSGEAPDPVLVSDLAWFTATELQYELPSFEEFDAALAPPNPNFGHAEQMCLDILRSRRSHAVQVLLAAIVYEKSNSDGALKLLKGVVREGPGSLEPANVTGLLVRSEILFRMGRREEARLDFDALQTVYEYDALRDARNTEANQPEFGFSIDISSDPRILISLVGFHTVVYFLVCLRYGRRQRREAGGTLRRLVAVSLAVALLWSLPFLAAAILIFQQTENPPGLIWWIFFEFFAFIVVRSSMNPPNLTYVGSDPLPECSDPLLLARIVALSERIGVSTPVVRTQRALDAGRDASAAFVGGLAPHSIVLYDTILAQLKHDEQDAIIGHELGHIANRSIWVYVTVYPLAAVGIVVLSFLGGSYFGTIAGMAVYVGSFRILSRRFEYDCDRRSAIATSPDAMARGLRRIYARHPLGRPGLLTSIVHSTASHPSLDERVHALSELAASGAAGAGLIVSVPFDPQRVALCRKLVWFFAIAWLSLTAFGITARLLEFAGPAPLIAVHLAAFGPLLLVRAAVRRPTKIGALRVKGRFHSEGARSFTAEFAVLRRGIDRSIRRFASFL